VFPLARLDELYLSFYRNHRNNSLSLSFFLSLSVSLSLGICLLFVNSDSVWYGLTYDSTSLVPRLFFNSTSYEFDVTNLLCTIDSVSNSILKMFSELKNEVADANTTLSLSQFNPNSR